MMNFPQFLHMLHHCHAPHSPRRDPFWPLPRPKTLAGRIAAAIVALLFASCVIGGPISALYLICWPGLSSLPRPSSDQSPKAPPPRGNPREQEAIDAIVSMGGTVTLDEDDPEKSVVLVDL